MNTPFSGVCIGGPQAGRWIAHQTDHYVVHTTVGGPRPVAYPSDLGISTTVRRHVYMFKHFFGVDLWVDENLYKDGPEAVLRELAAHYRPLV